MTENGNRKHVLIVGAGFAGLHCAQQLAADSNVDVTLLDRNNYQQFQPLLYQVATGALSPDNAAFNLRDVFRSYPNVTIRMAATHSFWLRVHKRTFLERRVLTRYLSRCIHSRTRNACARAFWNFWRVWRETTERRKPV